MQNAGREGAHWPGTTPAHSQAVAVDGQVSPASRKQRELGDHLLRELRQHTCAQEKGGKAFLSVSPAPHVHEQPGSQ